MRSGFHFSYQPHAFTSTGRPIVYITYWLCHTAVDPLFGIAVHTYISACASSSDKICSMSVQGDEVSSYNRNIIMLREAAC